MPTKTTRLDPGSLSDTLKILRQFGDEAAAVRSLRRACRKAATPTLKALERAVPYLSPDPVNDYHLRDFMKMQLEQKRLRKTAAEFRIGPARVTSEPGDGSNRKIVGGLSDSEKAPNYAIVLEKQRAWMLPVFNSQVSTMIRLFAAEARKDAIKTATRLEKKQKARLD